MIRSFIHPLFFKRYEMKAKKMKTCILTVIKNEQKYLDEWIQYHLHLGIDHIFIFEDIDSDSHKSITDKYDDKVSLSNISSILSEEDNKKAIWLKQTHKWNAQHMYFRNGLRYILNTFPCIYDWCFIVDADEFITLSNQNNTIEEVVNLYKDYDAFIMQWKCYGASGNLTTPDYSNKGVIEIYTQEVDNSKVDKAPSLVKTCYNLNRYTSEFFHNQHHPTDICNWCNTKFQKDINNPVYTNIFIRHYITKSWEEYVWKKKSRGFMWGRTRGYDLFFDLNPDMLNKKNQLMIHFND